MVTGNAWKDVSTNKKTEWVESEENEGIKIEGHRRRQVRFEPTGGARWSNDKMESYDGDVTKPLVRSGWSSRTKAGEKTGKGVVEKAAKDKVMMKGRGSAFMYDLEGNVILEPRSRIFRGRDIRVAVEKSWKAEV